MCYWYYRIVFWWVFPKGIHFDKMHHPTMDKCVLQGGLFKSTKK